MTQCRIGIFFCNLAGAAGRGNEDPKVLFLARTGIVTGLSTTLSPEKLMWPFSKASDDLQGVVEELRTVRAELARARRERDDLDMRLTELESKHLSLRGRVYSAGIHKQPLRDTEDSQQATIPRSKDELRKMIGFRPGQPYPHKDDSSTFDQRNSDHERNGQD
jgi:hypothetical protein